MQVMSNKSRIAQFVWSQKETFNKEISEKLDLSMPTVLKNVNELKAEGILQEVGVYESMGGRKARRLSMVSELYYAVGLEITQNHVNFVITNLSGEIVYSNRFRQKFENDKEYFKQLNHTVLEKLAELQISSEKVLGIGITLPGIFDMEKNMFLKSHILDVEDIKLGNISSLFEFPVVFDNDANSALFCELQMGIKNAWYISLSNSVGGALCQDGELYLGNNNRAGEIGHMIVERNGKVCYCGKKGCLDAYCSAKILSDQTEDNLAVFFQRLNDGDEKLEGIWDEYLEYLAIAISNVRMCLDCDVILGGYVGAYMEPYIMELENRILKYDIFEKNISYVKTCCAGKDASALGGALYHIRQFMCEL